VEEKKRIAYEQDELLRSLGLNAEIHRVKGDSVVL
jgi:hypothetical protein